MLRRNQMCLPAFGGAKGDQGSMFKLLHLKLRRNLHITLKLCIQVRSSELRQRLTRVHPEMVDFGFRQGPSEFSTAGIARYFED
jgi:hypothetical protein